MALKLNNVLVANNSLSILYSNTQSRHQICLTLCWYSKLDGTVLPTYLITYLLTQSFSELGVHIT